MPAGVSVVYLFVYSVCYACVFCALSIFSFFLFYVYPCVCLENDFYNNNNNNNSRSDVTFW